MNHRLTLSTAALLLIPPLLWAGNAVVGRAVHDMVPPMMLNFLRWALAAVLLLPLGYPIFRRGSSLWTNWRRYALLGLLGVGSYNALQYLALHTSSPVNVTLVAASMPVWMLIIGRLFHRVAIRPMQIIGSALSLAGVLVILAQGQWTQLLQLHFVTGDLLMVLATIIWSFYSWQLIYGHDSDAIRATWATFLLAQVVYGAAWSGLFAAVEWSFTDFRLDWSWTLSFALVYVAIGPAIIAMRFWAVGVQRVGPTTAGFFNNLTPLFAALLSLAMLGDMPQIYHAIAFALILGGIVLSSQRRN
jgi:drug/metabolite transporter (DMT)-like permease